MIAVRKSEVIFNHSITIDLANDKKLFIIINILSFALVVAFYFLFYFAAINIVEESGESLFYYLQSYHNLSTMYFLVSLIFTMVFHEMIHGLFFYLATRSMPVFGFKKMMAYAGAPDWYIRKDYYVVIALAPFVLITIICLAILALIPDKFSSIVFLTMVVHAAGCIGDFWYTALLLNKPKETYITDSGVVSVISYN